jgi:hypothetical protein
MRKLAAVLGVCAGAAGAFAQGTVTFFPTPSTLSSVSINGNTIGTGGAVGLYFYGLLTAASPSGPFSFTGTYATNLAVAGYFGSPAARTVTGWAAGATLFYEVAAWTSDLGPTFNPSWLTGNFGGGAFGAFGLSEIATGAAGGLGTPATPPLPLFGSTGITSGILLVGPVPEPSSMALAGLGAAALLIFRRRK